MTNFLQHSPAAQLEIARVLALQKGITIEEMLERLRKAGEITQQNLDDLNDRLKAEELKAIQTLADNAITANDHNAFNDAFPDFVGVQTSPLLEQLAQDQAVIDKIRDDANKNTIEVFQDAIIDDNFKIKDAFGNTLAQGQDVLTFSHPDFIDSLISNQQSGFIQKAQDEIFSNALSFGTFSEVTEADKKEIARLRTLVSRLEKEIRQTERPLRIEENEEIAAIDIKLQADLARIGNDPLRFNDRVRVSQAAGRKRGEVQKKFTILIRDATAEMRNDLRIAQGQLRRLENTFATFNQIEDLRLKIIADIESFKMDDFIDSTEQLLLRDLINQASTFITNVLSKNVAISQDKITELQLGILEVNDLLKNAKQTQVFADSLDLFGGVKESTDIITNNEITVDNEINDFFAGIGEFFTGEGNVFGNLGLELGKAFNPPEDEMVEMIVKAARAQQSAANILQRGR